MTRKEMLERYQQIYAAFDEGANTKEIAHAFGMSRRSIFRILGPRLAARRYSKWETAKLLLASGKSYSEIARELGTTRGSAWCLLNNKRRKYKNAKRETPMDQPNIRDVPASNV